MPLKYFGISVKMLIIFTSNTKDGIPLKAEKKYLLKNLIFSLFFHFKILF